MRHPHDQFLTNANSASFGSKYKPEAQASEYFRPERLTRLRVEFVINNNNNNNNLPLSV